MLSRSVGEVSAESWNQTRPVRSQTYIRPLLSKVIPTASPHGPEMVVSVKPAGTVDASTFPTKIRQLAAATTQLVRALLIRQSIESLTRRRRLPPTTIRGKVSLFILYPSLYSCWP